MVRNVVVLGGNSHPELVRGICERLGIPPAAALLGKFSVGETRVEIKDSVRGKDVFVIQSGSGKVNDNLMELLIMISACKTASAQRVTAVLPLFPYSRQNDAPDKKTGAPLKAHLNQNHENGGYTFESRPTTPHAGRTESTGVASNGDSLSRKLDKLRVDRHDHQSNGVTTNGHGSHQEHKRTTSDSPGKPFASSPLTQSFTPENHTTKRNSGSSFTALDYKIQPGYREWIAQAGTLIANLLTCAGADHIITLDLHDPQYQGFFDIPVDNLYGRPLLQNYIQYNIPNFRDAVIVSPDAGGAKRATAIADDLQMAFALIHKERRPTKITDRQNATMMLVGEVSGRTAILIDDLIDTSNTITRAAKLLKKEGATKVYALVTHGVFSGDAIDRINASALDTIVVTNSVPQHENQARSSKVVVLDVDRMFAEAIRRVHNGESISALFSFGGL